MRKVVIYIAMSLDIAGNQRGLVRHYFKDALISLQSDAWLK